MKQVSEGWQKAIRSQTRETKATVRFPFIDPEAKSSAEFNIVPQESAISDKQGILGNDPVPAGKIANFEPGYWKLDGSFILPKKKDETYFWRQYGFRGYALSDENCEFSSDNVLRFHFTQPITVPGYTLYFDEQTDEYLTDFDIISYDEDLSVIRKVEVRGNTKTKCVVEQGSEGVKYLDLVFLKTNNPFRSVRLLGIDFGILLMFEGENLYKVQLTCEADYLSDSIPRNELVFSAYNGGEYDYTNPESYSKYLQERQEVEYKHRVKLEDGSYEEIDMGKYLLTSWTVSDRSVEFKAVDGTDRLDEVYVPSGDLSPALGARIEIIFADILFGVNYEITPWVRYHTPFVRPYFGDGCTRREALAKLAKLCGCVVFVTTSGKVVVEKIEFNNNPSDTVDYSNQFSSPNSKSVKYYNAIQLTVYTEKEDGSFESREETHTAPWYQSGEPIYAYKLDLPMCIDDQYWEELKSWMLEQNFRVLGLRLSVDISWRQNPAQELGDYVSVQLDKSGGSAELFMQKQIATFSGGVLKGNSVGIGQGRV